MAGLSASVLPDIETALTTVEVRGRLDISTAPELRVALRKAVAECPNAVIVDVSGCRPANAAMLAVFAAAAAADPARPAVPLVLYAPGPAFARLASAALGPVHVYPSRTAAIHAVETGAATPHRASHYFGRSLAAPALARAAVHNACTAWDLEDLQLAAMTVISELVTNAVTHAASDATVDIALRGHFLHLRVRDVSSQPPVMGAAGPNDRGNGLPIVARLSTAWGCVVSPDGSGKVVWSTLRTHTVT